MEKNALRCSTCAFVLHHQGLCGDALETAIVRLVELSHMITAVLEPMEITDTLLASKLAEAEEKFKVVSTELETLQSETILAKQSEEITAQLRDKIGEKSAEINSLQKEIQQLNVACEKQLAEEKGCVKILREKLQEKDAHFFEHMQKISDLQKQVSVLECSRRQSETENETLRTTASDSDNEVKTLMEEVANVKSELTMLKSENESLILEKTSSSEDKERMAKEVAALSNQIMDIENNLAESSENQIICLRDKMKVQREENISAEAESASLRVEKDQIVCDYDELVTKTEEDNLKCEQEIKKLHEDVRSLTKDQNRLTSEIECLTKELLAVQTKLSHCESENKTLTCVVGDMKETCVKLEADVECESREKNEFMRTLREKEEIVRTLMTTIEGLKQNEDVIQKEKQVMWQEIKRLRLALESAKSTEESQIHDLQKTVTDIRSENEQELKSERQIVVDLRKQHELDLKTEMKSVLETLVKFTDKPDDWCESITVDTVELKAQLELAFNEKDATIHDLREESCRTDTKLEVQIAEYEKKTEHCAKLEESVVELTSEVDDYRKRVTVAHVQLDTATAELSQERTDAETKMNESLDEATSLYDSRISDATAELELARAAVVAMETELREGRETFQQQLSALKFQHSSEQMLHQSTLKVRLRGHAYGRHCMRVLKYTGLTSRLRWLKNEQQH